MSKEKPTIREIKYVGLSSVSQSDVLDKFKERKVGLTQESQYDPTKVKRAEVVIKELLAAHGHQFATVTSEVRPIPPAAVGLTFVIKEGPKVKVGKITFEGNKALNSRELQSAMKNLKPIGVPHSVFTPAFLENLFPRTYDSTKLNEDAERVRYFYQTKGYFKALVADPEDADPRHQAAVVLALFQEAGQGRRYHASGGRRRSLQAEGDHVYRQQGGGRYSRLARPVQDQRRRHLRYRGDPQGPGEPAQGLCGAGLHQFRACAEHRRQ